MITFESVSKVYQTPQGEVRALDNVSLSISAGEFIAVRGHSGCGKSTLLSLAGGLSTPTTGQVHVAGQNLTAMSSSQRAALRATHIGFVFQMFHLLPYLSVLDNVLVAADNAPAAKQEALALLERFGMADRLQHRPAELSAGERQRTAMARALLHHPQLLLADEPTGNLDPQNAVGVLDLIAEFHQQGGTVLLVTHDETAAGYAQQTLELRAGKRIDPVAGQPG
ncbi:ABC transporter ATP-binding protein [Lignipirellula cremea]|uniref:Lipoprotein-releasing system ATP-binding protein LolD n=1 Tax=Lignipirellula cremea TaxID=2528010 RepID=A0A518E1N2_9BACT|nr:ABC transporter ATP-binding protein [Lignipirellula cremea]QDU98000.1 Lipoprotein-releasing system ATP-binding protein LolD [Lignipirellula cremea]